MDFSRDIVHLLLKSRCTSRAAVTSSAAGRFNFRIKHPVSYSRLVFPSVQSVLLPPFLAVDSQCSSVCTSCSQNPRGSRTANLCRI
ncbi:hypothetical protein M758_UG113900 [Ceratodon purpureus]|nr:hypothetical protein M758_UG113900 [Ceratodon purpureus]